MGRWRTHEGSTPVDATGAMPTGEKFAGAGELKKILLGRSELFVGAYTEKLMMYALGRNVQYYDVPSIRKIVRQSKQGNYQFATLVEGVVQSAPFQMRSAKKEAPKQ